MSDQPDGPGWWLASDGKWYPPDQAPPVPPPEMWATPTPSPTPTTGLSSGAITALVVGGVLAVLLLIGLMAAFVGTDADPTTGTDPTSDTDATTDAAAPGSDPDAVAEVAPPSIPEGFEVAEGDGASIAVPAGWTVLDPEDVAMSPEELAEAFPDASPEVVEQEEALFEQGAVLVAFDVAGDAFASNVNVVRFPTLLGLDELADQAELEIEGIGGEVRSNRQVQLPVGPAVRVAYEADVTLPDGSTQSAQGVQHYVPVGGRTYVITVTSADDVGDVSDQMAATFRVA